jgi:phytoene desaturase
MTTSTGKRIVIIGAGPGGLAAAMILAHRGFQVTVCERLDRVGGRNSEVRLGDFSFDLGPTFLMMKEVLEKVFEEAGFRASDFLQFQRLEPMYRLQFPDRRLEPTSDREGMRAEIERAFPGRGASLDGYLKREKARFDHLYPCLQVPYGSPGSLLSRNLIKAIPHLGLGKNLFDILYRYFGDEKLALAFTFQAKYLGMSPWDCPGLFAILSYIEHAFGVYHTRGGLWKNSEAMAKAAGERGAEIRLETPVKEIILDGRRAAGVVLESGERIAADEVVINADFGYAMENLFPEGFLRKYRPKKLARRKFSCSTFMLYLGLDKVYGLPHHTIFFADDYRTNVDEVFKTKKLSSDISFYVRNASVSDPALAPEGQSAVYVLVPVPNLRGEIDWEREKAGFRDLVLDRMEARGGMKDLRSHILAERMITPAEWRDDYNVYAGATFNLAHNFGQMIYLRPRNRFEECRSCWLVGGGTHPGSGLPTIYESGRITANLISDKHRVSRPPVGEIF